MVCTEGHSCSLGGKLSVERLLEPSHLIALGSNPASGISVNFFRFSPSIQKYIQNASLVISHGGCLVYFAFVNRSVCTSVSPPFLGAGSILEVLRSCKPLVVVINEKLMHNHQWELARALGDGGFLMHCTPKSLTTLLKGAEWKNSKVYPGVDVAAFPRLLDEELRGGKEV